LFRRNYTMDISLNISNPDIFPDMVTGTT
jgi:hypothetical protein